MVIAVESMSSTSAQPIPDPAFAAESNLARILAITGIFHFLALISVGLRLYCRVGLLKTPGRDDVAIVLAYVSVFSALEYNLVLT
jgi:hypothetical protein